MSDVKSTKVFTVRNLDTNQLLKYFFSNEKNGTCALFNDENHQKRFHTCGTRKCAEKLAGKIANLGFTVDIVEMEKADLVQAREASKELKRLRNSMTVATVVPSQLTPAVEDVGNITSTENEGLEVTSGDEPATVDELAEHYAQAGEKEAA